MLQSEIRYLKCSRLYHKTNQQILIRLKLTLTLIMCQHNLSIPFKTNTNKTTHLAIDYALATQHAFIDHHQLKQILLLQKYYHKIIAANPKTPKYYNE